MVGPLPRLPRAVTTPPRSRAYVPTHAIRTSLWASAIPGATVADVRESLALRERIVSFAADAQGLDAAALHERFRAEF